MKSGLYPWFYLHIAHALTKTILNLEFVNNSSKSFGGGLYVDGARRPTQARYSVAPQDGPGRQVIVRKSRFEGNHATGFGGGIAVWGYDHDYVTIEDSLITKNEVTSDPKDGAKGGGLKLSGFININNTTISNNKSSQDGGGLWYDGAVSAKIQNSSFAGNQAGKGGAIFSAQYDSTTNVINCPFLNNSASSEGGAIYQDNMPISVDSSSTFNNNVPDEIAQGSNAKKWELRESQNNS